MTSRKLHASMVACWYVGVVWKKRGNEAIESSIIMERFLPASIFLKREPVECQKPSCIAGTLPKYWNAKALSLLRMKLRSRTENWWGCFSHYSSKAFKTEVIQDEASSETMISLWLYQYPGLFIHPFIIQTLRMCVMVVLCRVGYLKDSVINDWLIHEENMITVL